ncbi:YtnP family quorum-quenching lactonase [Bacillus chungangensis]|uniref:Glyoxylase-like metal-dependent hydrolase (Beta-lactamase superfamily II) n=1 Tax=Bacillus chungangensis TaxID=587633 RepID=A0ABT9WUU7_9BACI|nr:MBL fold metallo-hydrolase [Bacillus chungangensis]MDQ0176883.1 glyoxylase-like metal-dependent hydrolase (beta-lactamase superfamily II) [Bacillus chungangensis]
MEILQLGEITLKWLNGGVIHMDGGAMFGVVPKPLWSKKYPVNDRNQIELRTDPIYLEANGKHILIEAGIGNEKFTKIQKRNFGVQEESTVAEQLESLGLSTDQIDIICMTHMHFDHACGLTKWENGELVSTFPNATIYTSQTEWAEMLAPNIRSKNTYWKANWEPIVHQVKTYEDQLVIANGIKMIHTGGHSDGHSIIVIESKGEKLIHLADLMPTHAHQNPLWVLAYDDYPMDSIRAKQTWIPKAIAEGAWFTFYHDAYYRAIKLDKEGIIDEIKRIRPE